MGGGYFSVSPTLQDSGLKAQATVRGIAETGAATHALVRSQGPRLNRSAAPGHFAHLEVRYKAKGQRNRGERREAEPPLLLIAN